jgi:hypothetical protein
LDSNISEFLNDEIWMPTFLNEYEKIWMPTFLNEYEKIWMPTFLNEYEKIWMPTFLNESLKKFEKWKYLHYIIRNIM